MKEGLLNLMTFVSSNMSHIFGDFCVLDGFSVCFAKNASFLLLHKRVLGGKHT